MSKEKKYIEYAIAPGETITELLESNCMTQIDLANKTGINKKTINEIIKGKAPITQSTALKLEYVFNIPASFWNKLENNYREKLERIRDKEDILKDIKNLANIPYLEMAKRNWNFISKTKNEEEKVINLRKFFSVGSLNFDTELKKSIMFRKSKNDNFSWESLYCWLRYGEIISSKEKYPNFNIITLKESINEIRNLSSYNFLDKFNEIKEILSNCGVSLVFESALPNTYVNGLSYKIRCDRAIVMLSDRGKRDDILWFTLFHELAHLIKHSKKEVFVDLENDEKTDIENEADEFSKNILINKDEYKKFIKNKTKYNEDEIRTFSKNNNISTGILVGRLQKDGYIKWSDFNNLIVRIN